MFGTPKLILLFSLVNIVIIYFFLIYLFYHGKLGMMGNFSRVETRARMRYLTDRTRHALNKNARVKLYKHEAKLCIFSAWFLMHLSSHGTKEHCMSVGVILQCSLFFLFLFPAKG